MSGFFPSSARLTALLAVCLPLLGGCNEPKQAAAEPVQDEPHVGIVVARAEPRAIVRELPGRIAPVRVSDVRPRVSGIIVARNFRQGSEVKAGDPLYHIDPRPFEVELQSSEAALAKAEAVLLQASQHARRIGLLTSQRTAPEAENEKAIAAERQAAADVDARKADVARAELNLDYATVRAPIDGVVGAAQLSEGALVVQHDAATLATIQQLDSVYADFTQSAAELTRLRRAFETGELDRIAPDAIKVGLVLDDGTLYPLPGKLLFSEAKVDAQTGQVTLRGEFLNPGRELLPGMYVRIRIEQGIDADSIAVPQQAVQRNNGGGSEVFVVEGDNKVVARPVRTGSVQDGVFFVTAGLKAGDRVVVDGFQKFAAGDKVRPQSWAEADTDIPAVQPVSLQR